MDWDWTRQKIGPADVLDAARNIKATGGAILINPTSHWVESSRYLEWAILALDRGGDEAWDSAACILEAD